MRLGRKATNLTVAALSALALAASPALAAPVLYTGNDPGAGPADARPNADAARIAFDGAASGLGALTIIDFEAQPLGAFGVLFVAPGVTATLFGDVDGSDPFGAGIRDHDQDSDIGYNTTAGGDQFLRVTPLFGYTVAGVTFNFTTPISAFGGYITDNEAAFSGLVRVSFFDGSFLTYDLTNTSPSGVEFWGFTDSGKSISAVTFTEIPEAGVDGRDIWAIDDIRWVHRVPEPSSLLLIGAGLSLLAVRRRRG